MLYSRISPLNAVAVGDARCSAGWRRKDWEGVWAVVLIRITINALPITEGGRT